MLVKFRNSHDWYHFYGPAAMWIVVLILITIASTVFEYSFMFIIAILVLLSPKGWEYWDAHKVVYNDPRAMDWNRSEREIFTSEGFADPYDAYLGHIGILLATAVYIAGYSVWYFFS